MHSQTEHLQLTERLFRSVIAHLSQRIKKPEALQDEDEEGPRIAAGEHEHASERAAVSLRLEICLNSLCLDRIHQLQEDLTGVRDDARCRARDNFFRLMSALANAKLTSDAHARSFGLVSQSLHERPLTDAQMFTALEGAAERQLAELIAM